MRKRVFVLAALAALSVLAVCLTRAVTLGSRQIEVPPAAPVSLDSRRLAERLAGAIRFATISSADPDHVPIAELQAQREYLERTFPRVHERLARETVASHSLLYRWQGADRSLAPIVLLAHQDVVPVTEGTESLWEHPPFSGAIAGGYVWGRGAMDNKSALMGALEAIELLIESGFAPVRTVLLVVSHDEEVRGDGARAIADLLRSRGVRAELVLDEGLLISDGIVPGVSAPVALVGSAEKGFLAVELVAESDLGHVAFPPARPTVSRLARALVALDESPFAARFEGAPRELYGWIGGDMSFAMRLIAANLWLFAPLVKAGMAATPPTNALLRTTSAATMLEAGPRLNVLPNRARAVVVFFVHPSETTEDVLGQVRRIVGDDVLVRVVERGEPSPRSPSDSRVFAALARSVRETFPRALVAPSLLAGNVDARHYIALSDHVYRFTPIVATREDVSRIHGTNERIAVEAHADVVRFYVSLLRNTAAPSESVEARKGHARN